MSAWDDARENVGCEVCFAEPRQPCVYLGPVNPPPRDYPLAALSASMRKQIEQEGKPMAQGHYLRLMAWQRVVNRRLRRERERARREAIPPEPAWLRPLREFDAAEVEQMRQWLRENHRLFRLRRIEH